VLDDFDEMASLGDSDDPRLRSLADLFEAARATGTDEELQHNAALVSAMAAAARNAVPQIGDLVERTPRRSPTKRKIAVRASVVAAFVLAGASTAAAATGTLPHTAQSLVARATSHVGLHLPDPDEAPPLTDARAEGAAGNTPSAEPPHSAPHTTDEAPSQTEQRSASSTSTDSTASTNAADDSDAAEPSDDANTSIAAAAADDSSSLPTTPAPPGSASLPPGTIGLCQAWLSDSTNPSNAEDHAASMQRLQEAAATAGRSVEDLCSEVLPVGPESAVTSSPPPSSTGEGNSGPSTSADTSTASSTASTIAGDGQGDQTTTVSPPSTDVTTTTSVDAGGGDANDAATTTTTTATVWPPVDGALGDASGGGTIAHSLADGSGRGGRIIHGISGGNGKTTHD